MREVERMYVGGQGEYMWEGGEGGEDVGSLDELVYEAAQDQ